MFTEKLSASKLFWRKSVFLVPISSLYVNCTSPCKTYNYLTNTVTRPPWQRWKMFSQPRKLSFLMKVLEQRSGKKIQGKSRTETVTPAIYNLTFISQPSSSFKKVNIRVNKLREIKQVHESLRQVMNKSRNRI